jgi:hypothetical protein
MMCKKCDQIDEKIAGYRTIAERILDDSALLIIALMIKQCETQKHELHAEDTEGRFLTSLGVVSSLVRVRRRKQA